jgi:hypothetical protein
MITSSQFVMGSTKILLFFLFCLSLNHNCVLSSEQITSKDLAQNEFETTLKTSNSSLSQPIDEDEQNSG